MVNLVLALLLVCTILVTVYNVFKNSTDVEVWYNPYLDNIYYYSLYNNKLSLLDGEEVSVDRKVVLDSCIYLGVI